MQSKYKPGFYFGILTFIFNLIIILTQYPQARTGNNLIWMLGGALTGGLVGGLIFGWMWNWLRKRHT